MRSVFVVLLKRLCYSVYIIKAEAMQMKVTVVFSSPRKKGNTAALLSPFMDELKMRGAEIDYYDVYEKNISGCRACLQCQKDTSRAMCVIEDDMQPILSSVSESELLVIAAPVYCWGLPGPVKTVLDRLIYAFCKYYGDDPHGPALLAGKKLALITTCGYPVEKGADLLEESMKRTAKHCKLSYAGMLAERQRNLKEPFMNEEKEEHARAFAKSLI
jgi:multimeric flavodoxin WrbA